MSTFDEERLRILARVSAGELTPQQGSLEIAMLKVSGHEGLAAPEPEIRERRQPPGVQLPSRAALARLFALPLLVMGGLVTTFMAFFMALPAYLVMSVWNGVVVPMAPGLAPLGFWQTLAVLVVAALASSALSWGRRIRVFMSGGPGIREQ